MSSNPNAIVHSKRLQSAVFGNALADKPFLVTCRSAGVTSAWYIEPHLARLWSLLVDFVEAYKRLPSAGELMEDSSLVGEDPKEKSAYQRELNTALDAALEHGIDSLTPLLKEWAVAQLLRTTMEEVVRHYNKGDVETASTVMGDNTRQLGRIEATFGLKSRFEPSSARLVGEREQRIQEGKNLLKYGVGYLDDSLYGLLKTDVILLGGKSGTGKTQLACNIAMNLSAQGARTSFFALEAENREVERRVKYGVLAKLYRIAMKEKGQEPKPLEYSAWRLGLVDDLVAPFEATADRYVEKATKNLRTYYKTSGTFNVDDLEKGMLDIARESDVLVLDHIHYVDIDSDNENLEQKKIVKTIRNIALEIEKPILVLAHLRKTGGGKNSALLPNMEDFMGSSDLFKAATTVVMLGPCPSVQYTCERPPELDGTRPTFMKIVKARLEGSRLWYTAIAHYDYMLGVYQAPYALGTLKDGDQKWVGIERSSIPHWAKNATVSCAPIQR